MNGVLSMANFFRLGKFGFAATVLTLSFSQAASAHDEHGSEGGHGAGGHHFVPKANPAPTEPAKTYSGNQAIDLKHGITFNQGTYGVPNPEIEAWAKNSTWAVGLAERPYPYSDKAKFLATLNQRIQHFEHAVWNWGRKSEKTKPEVVEYAQKATAEITPKIESARKAWKAAKSSGESNWEKSQDEAKRAFLELQSFYYSLHRNVR
jgi:hypothetical protein